MRLCQAAENLPNPYTGTFTHEDEYKKALQLLSLAAQQKDYEQRKVG